MPSATDPESVLGLLAISKKIRRLLHLSYKAGHFLWFSIRHLSHRRSRIGGGWRKKCPRSVPILGDEGKAAFIGCSRIMAGPLPNILLKGVPMRFVQCWYAASVALVGPAVQKVMPWVVFVLLAVAMLFDPGRETLGIPSACFAATLALASVAFSYGRTLKDGSSVRDELIFAGERLVSAAILFLVAAILNHAARDVPRYAESLLHAIPHEEPIPDRTVFGQNVYGFIIGMGVFLFFLGGLINGQRGLMVLLAISAHRANLKSNTSDYFPHSKKEIARIAEMVKDDGRKP